MKNLKNFPAPVKKSSNKNRFLFVNIEFITFSLENLKIKIDNEEEDD